MDVSPANILLLVITVSFSIIGFMFARKMNKDDEDRKNLYNLIDITRSGIKSDDEILAVVNGKYVSRREADQTNEQRKEWRDLLMGRIGAIDAEILRLRNSHHHLSNAVQKIPVHVIRNGEDG